MEKSAGKGGGGACSLQFLFMDAWRLAVVHLRIAGKEWQKI